MGPITPINVEAGLIAETLRETRADLKSTSATP